MSSKKPKTQEAKLEEKIKNFLLDFGVRRIKNEALEFGYEFNFPPGKDPTGRVLGRTLRVIKPKNIDILEIGCGTKISPAHIRELESSRRLDEFYNEITKVFLLKDLQFQLVKEQHMYSVKDIFYLHDGFKLEKNAFMTKVQRIVSATIYSIVLINEFISIK